VQYRPILAVAAILVALAAAGLAGDAPFGLADDGTTILYRAQPGDTPQRVAAMLGIPAEELSAFLRENRVGDATRVPVGFVYRVPNRAARAAHERLAVLEVEQVGLRRDLAQARGDVERLTREAAEARASASDATRRADSLATLEWWWPMVRAGFVLLGLATAGMAALASAAVRRQQQAERRLQGLARELDDKRRAALAERQESGRRVLDLESRIRFLEGQLPPQVMVRR
jgi:hypothetical protein